MHLKSIFILLALIAIESAVSVSYQCDSNASCGCSSVATASINSRIVGGEEAQDRAFGWIVSLQYNGRHICGASLISADYAVTAAQCVDHFTSYSPRSLSILAGTNYLSATFDSNAQRRNITNIHKHPYYLSSSFVNDIAVIRFSPLVTDSNKKLSFICLPDVNQDPFIAGTQLVAIGWGGG
jgi:secreted trypsin-like serine protease